MIENPNFPRAVRLYLSSIKQQVDPPAMEMILKNLLWIPKPDSDQCNLIFVKTDKQGEQGDYQIVIEKTTTIPFLRGSTFIRRVLKIGSSEAISAHTLCFGETLKVYSITPLIVEGLLQAIVIRCNVTMQDEAISNHYAKFIATVVTPHFKKKFGVWIHQENFYIEQFHGKHKFRKSLNKKIYERIWNMVVTKELFVKPIAYMKAEEEFKRLTTTWLALKDFPYRSYKFHDFFLISLAYKLLKATVVNDKKEHVYCTMLAFTNKAIKDAIVEIGRKTAFPQIFSDKTEA